MIGTNWMLVRRRQTAFGNCLALMLCVSGTLAIAQAPGGSVPQNDSVRSPVVTSWFMINSGRYARVVEQMGSTPAATWPSPALPNFGGGQSKPAYADVQQVRYSQNWVYVTGTGLASHQMGPWYIGLNRIFGNWPTNQSFIRRFPRNPQPAAHKVTNGLGDLGVWVNGVALFNMLDGAHYDPVSRREVMAPPFQQQNGSLWVRNAVSVESPTFDKSNAHQPPMGTYHYHSNPLGLRHQLGDNVVYDPSTDSYHEATAAPHHSPILGWSYDGYPIYGPYAYSDPKDPNSAVRRMISGFVLEDGRNHTVDLRLTGRKSLAKWAAELHQVNVDLKAEQAGPDVSARYPLGRYCEDYAYLGDLGFAQGKDFDLDIHNGRFCVTPEYPQGTYAYFVTLDQTGTAAFPYVIGRQYYGAPTGGNVGRIEEPVLVFRTGGADTPIETKLVKMESGHATLEWSSVEGGHYRIQRSANGADWTTLIAEVQAQGSRTSIVVPAIPGIDSAHYRVTRTAMDPYDDTAPGQLGGPGRPGRDIAGFGGPGGPNGGPGGGTDAPPNGRVGAVRPTSAKPGKFVIVFITLDADRVPPEFVQPFEVKLGGLKALKAAWNGETVIAKFALPSNTPKGNRDVMVVFPGPPGTNFHVSFIGKAAFTVR